MKLKSVVFAAGLIAVPALAFAQSSPAPVNQSGPGVTKTQSPTEMGAAGVSGETKAVKGTSSKMKMGKRSKKDAPTTGSNIRERQQRNASPASGAEGAEKVK
jgi:hypothetical protein